MDSTNTSNKYLCERCEGKNYLIECKCGCTKVRFLVDDKGRIREYIHNHHVFGENNSNWNGGIRYRYNYRYILMPDYPRAGSDGYVVEHVYVYEQYNKCCLLPWGEVHHLDPVREGYCNNMPWNLIGVTKWQHRTLDRTKDMSNRRCSKCSSTETYKKQNGRDVWYGKTEDTLICKLCYDRSRKVKRERKQKDWTGTICFLCGSDKTISNGRKGKRWAKYKNGFICYSCYKKERKNNKK